MSILTHVSTSHCFYERHLAKSPLFVRIVIPWLNFWHVDVRFCNLTFGERCKSIAFTVLSKVRFFDHAFHAWIRLCAWENAFPCRCILELWDWNVQTLADDVIVGVITEIGRFTLLYKLITNGVFSTDLFSHFYVNLTWSVLASNTRHQLRVQITIFIGFTNHPVGIPLFLWLNINHTFFLDNVLVEVVLQVLWANVVELWYHVLAGCVVVDQQLIVVW